MTNEIRNCTVTFQCPKLWARLTPTDDPKVRFCDYCLEQVHLVETEQQLARHAALGHCVAILNLSPEHPAYRDHGLLGRIVPKGAGSYVFTGKTAVDPPPKEPRDDDDAA